MKSQARAALVALSVLVAAACGKDGGSASSGAPTPDPAAAPTASAVSARPDRPPCVAGTWRATGVRSASSAGTITGRVTGGAGVTMTVRADGVTEVGFQRSEPVDFTAEAGGAILRGRMQYDGSLNATVRFDPATDGTGRWQPQTGESDSDLRATVKLTEPVSVTLLDDARIGDLSGAADALDVLPVLRGGTYECADSLLRVRTLSDGPALTWTFTRTS